VGSIRVRGGLKKRVGRSSTSDIYPVNIFPFCFITDFKFVFPVIFSSTIFQISRD
jgi:hypothetical protein